MSKYTAAAFIKAGTCIRYLIDVQAGSAIGKARADQGQHSTHSNRRGEKLDSDNVLENMIQIEDLLDEIGFENVRSSERRYLKNTLVPDAMLIKRQDNGYGVLTEDLAQRISTTARAIRMGMLEAGKERPLYSEPENPNKWPREFSLALLSTVPPWLWVVFFGTIGLTVGFTETPAYKTLKYLLTPQTQNAPAAPAKPTGGDGRGKQTATRHDG